MKFTSILITTIALTSCAGIQPQEFAKFDNDRLCASPKWVLATKNDGLIQAMKSELVKRELMTEEKIADVYKYKANVGDNICYMVATRGQPIKRNTTITQNHVRIQWIYEDGYGRYYVYTDNGIITSLQF